MSTGKYTYGGKGGGKIDQSGNQEQPPERLGTYERHSCCNLL